MSTLETKLLYQQSCKTEDGVSVLSTIYTGSYTYPTASNKTIIRIRVTCIYSYSGENMIAHTGTLEQWRTDGWAFVDEFHDDNISFSSPEEFRSYMLDIAQSFILGIPLKSTYTIQVKEKTNQLNKPKSKKSNLRVIDFEKNKPKTKEIISSKKSNSIKKEDDDFDLI
jgi:hypothetical protein